MCDDPKGSQHLYGKLDGYPSGIGVEIITGQLKNLDNLACNHTPEQIMAGVHERRVVKYSTVWHYYLGLQENMTIWRAEYMPTSEDHTVTNWLRGIGKAPI